ncbi:flap endonuclease 1 isoform X2 [Tanacetum coccineum]
MEFDVSKVLEGLGLTMDQFIDLCILCVGGMTTLKLIRQHGSIETIPENTFFSYQIPEDWPYVEAQSLFKEPLVCVDKEKLDIKWSAPDEEVIPSKVDGIIWVAFNLGPDSDNDHHASCKGNPTANKWTPAHADTESYVSDKPHKSDSSDY